MSKVLSIAAAVLAAVSWTAPATALQITSVSIVGNGRAYINTPGIGTQTVSAGRLVLNDFNVFCIDVYHHIDLGSQNYSFTQLSTSSFTTDFGGHALSADTVSHIVGLAHLGGTLDAINADAVQQAIWTIENTGYKVITNDPGFGPTQSLVDHYVSLGMTLTGTGTILRSDDGHQSMVVAEIPEPTTWALLGIGFVIVGGAVRSRKTSIVAA